MPDGVGRRKLACGEIVGRCGDFDVASRYGFDVSFLRGDEVAQPVTLSDGVAVNASVFCDLLATIDEGADFRFGAEQIAQRFSERLSRLCDADVLAVGGSCRRKAVAIGEIANLTFRITAQGKEYALDGSV